MSIIYTSCAQVHELPQSRCGGNREGTHIYIYIYIKTIQGDIFFKISDISNLTNLQRTVTNKKYKKVYTY